MLPTNKRLESYATSTDAAEDKDKVKKGQLDSSKKDSEFLRLLNKWCRLNAVRATLVLGATVLGLAATVR